LMSKLQLSHPSAYIRIQRTKNSCKNLKSAPLMP
jgi:hypothetical protein